MKYKYLGQHIPQGKRKEINEKILYCIDNNLCEKANITNEVIYNSYTGDGGLHGLNFSKFNSFREFTKAKQEIENGQFFTHHNTVKYLMDILKVDNHKTILDLTCGIGNIFNFAKNEYNCFGCEIDRKSYKIAKRLYPNANIICGDMREYFSNIQFDFVIGNPPFNLDMTYKSEKQLSQKVFIKKSLDLLKTGGLLAIIVPESFLNDDFSNKSDIDFMNSNFNFICQIRLKENEFEYLGVNNFKTKIIIFQKKSKLFKDIEYKNIYVKGSSQEIHSLYIKPTYEELEKNKNKLYLENINNNTEKELDLDFEFKLKKILFDIKRSKHVNNRYAEAQNYISLYYNQKKPEGMDYVEWKKIEIKKDDVIKKLKDILSSQHRRRVIKSENIEKVRKRKERNIEKQNIKFENMKLDTDISNWLSNSKVYDHGKDEEIILNDEQKEIVNKMLQKRYGYIQASQGTGKTLMSIHYALYRKDFNNINNIVVVAPSIAINQTWADVLESYKISFTHIKKMKDIDSIKKDDFVLITFNMLCKYKKHIKKFLNKKISNKYLLLVDEADSICNLDSSRTKATLAVFKSAKFKLLLSGTMTRNNIVESYSQFKLLYGESDNFICRCQNKFVTDKESGKLKEEQCLDNEVNLPFPAYKKGLKLFRECFNPQSVTVFGVGQNTQNIYNSEELKELINKTIITKTFKEVVGKKIYNIHQEVVEFNNQEKQLYDKVINEFYSMKYLFSSTGNPRKDRMMEIIQQLTLLLNVCCQPQSYKEYDSKELPNKFKRVIELVEKWDDEKVIVGCRTLKEIELYEVILNNKFPNRNVYTITGSISMNKRKDIINDLKEDDNGILLCTQQSLSSSVNIEFIDKCIITRLSWNYSTLSQFFFRIIRYNSKNMKDIHFITYANSLESNLLQLLITKENLTNFMKNQESADVESELGVDFDLISMLLAKEKDKEGKSIIVNWGNQEIT
ncbi:helicase-related protein [Clostridium perfringens]|uniref:helicase-related protein n=1 Tax=Clostridium perfringens TaxID=1502 RepID=UPI003748479D